MFRLKLDVANKNYDPAVSKLPELIGKHPGLIAPLVLWKPNPLQFVQPKSAAAVSGVMDVELNIREDNEDLLENLKKIVITIDGKSFEFDSAPCHIEFDTSHIHRRLIRIKAEAIGKNEESEEAILASFYTHVIAENGPFDNTRSLVLFGGVFEPMIDTPRNEWTPDMFEAAYVFAKNIMTHLMHYGYVPDFLLEVDQYTVLLDPDQLDKGLQEYTPERLVDVLGRESGPGCDGKNYTDMIDTANWMEPTKTKLGTVLRGYHFPEMGLPNGIPNIFEAFAVHVISNYWKFAPMGGMRAMAQVPNLFEDVMTDLEKDGLSLPWDIYSLLIGEKPGDLKEKIINHIKENRITGVVLYDHMTDLSDFEDTKGVWEEVQDAIDLVTQETGVELPLSIVHTTDGDLQGTHPDFAEAVFNMTRNELESCSIADDAKVGIILGEHGFPPGNGEDDIIDYNMEKVRRNIRQVYDQKLANIRNGVTEYSLGMNEFNNHPDSWQLSSMECMVDYLHRGFDTIIFQPYYFTYETIDLFEHLRHWAFEVDGIDHEKEFHAGHEILPNYRSDFDFRGSRIIITGSLLGRYEKDGDQPRVKEAYRLYKSSIVETLTRKIRAL